MNSSHLLRVNSTSRTFLLHSHIIYDPFLSLFTSSLDFPSCMNSSTGPSHPACPPTPLEQIQPSPGSLPGLVTQTQYAYSYSWLMFTLTHQTLVPFVDPGMTPCLFQPYSTSGPFPFSTTIPYHYYMCSPTQSDPMNPHQSPHPSPSAHGHIYSPLVSPVSDTFVHEYHKSDLWYIYFCQSAFCICAFLYVLKIILVLWLF